MSLPDAEWITTNPLNDLFVGPGFDGVVGEQADTVLTVSDDVYLLSTRSRRDIGVENPS